MYNYTLEIYFKSNAVITKNFEIMSEYKRDYKDKITFSRDRICIGFQRSKKSNVETMIYNPNHTIHIQINTSLIYRWLIQQSKIDIKKMVIFGDKQKIEINQINDVFSDSIVKHNDIGLNELSPFLQRNQKNNKLIIAINHYMKALSFTTTGSKFEHFWKSFNSLYSIISVNTKEFDKLIDIKNYIWTNIIRFPRTIQKVKPITKLDIRNLRIRDLILNDYSDDSKTRAFKDFCLRNEDSRLCGVLKDTLVYREQFLKNHRMYSAVLSHLNNTITNNTIKGEQVLTFFVVKYSYFLRNRYFHAERLNEDFNLFKNQEVMGLTQINDTFEVFLYELIKSIL